MKYKIITIGSSPCWDRTIEIKGINWGQHKIISAAKIVPAGKALNINRALAQMGQKSIAAGLWGSDDWNEMKKATADLKRFVQIRFTKAKGKTRENITIIDTAKKRQIHLRSKSKLAGGKSLSDLDKDLQKIITKDSVCIFTGAMPRGKLLNKTILLIEAVKKKGAKIVIDTSGSALRKIAAKGRLFIIKPNVEELGELVGKKIPNQKNAIIIAAKKLLKKTEFVLVSRAGKGAVLIGRDAVLPARYAGRKYDVYNTVGCGDFLLAGFICEFCRTGNAAKAIEKGLRAATAKAFGRKS
ncbi:MAG: PfkB family carbohydrate kinase [Phycisphaerae bacterium]|nr:PfkB family carbohydrate kinase [Phycisphaerae bacterium]